MGERKWRIALTRWNNYKSLTISLPSKWILLFRNSHLIIEVKRRCPRTTHWMGWPLAIPRYCELLAWRFEIQLELCVWMVLVRLGWRNTENLVGLEERHYTYVGTLIKSVWEGKRRNKGRVGKRGEGNFYKNLKKGKQNFFIIRKNIRKYYIKRC